MGVYKSKQKRRKPSKFDPYVVEIATYLSMGRTIQEVAELIEYHFDDAVSKDSLYMFIRSRGLKSKVTQGGTNLQYQAPCCQGCENCLKVINTNEVEVNVCLVAKRIVNRSCKTSPPWCMKR
jgi:hypothetical protein